MHGKYVVVGGGIAGVSCVEILTLLEPTASIVLLSESSLIKTVTNLTPITKYLTSFSVQETNFEEFKLNNRSVVVLHEALVRIDDANRVVLTKSGLEIRYDYLCLCTGASAKLIPQHSMYPGQVIGIRDTDSVQTLVQKLKQSKKVVIVGNGGIATELVHQMNDAEIHWIIKDEHVSSTFLDPGAAEFFSLTECPKQVETFCKRVKYDEDMGKSGAALGPDWYKNLIIRGGDVAKRVVVHRQTTISDIKKEDAGKLNVVLSDGVEIICDLLVSATGVKPRVEFSHNLDVTGDGYIKVDEFMRTSRSNVYAAGDVCEPAWVLAKHWFPMKLWTQARQMGCYAARCMSGHSNQEAVLQDFCFEIFAHSTKLFGYKVILLGLFNGQKLGTGYEVLLRMTKGVEYVKLVIERGRLQGAILIGDTDLEEMCENLILNQLDISPLGDDILNPDIDIEDYFD